jgi:hypothetical protein
MRVEPGMLYPSLRLNLLVAIEIYLEVSHYVVVHIL